MFNCCSSSSFPQVAKIISDEVSQNIITLQFHMLGPNEVGIGQPALFNLQLQAPILCTIPHTILVIYPLRSLSMLLPRIQWLRARVVKRQPCLEGRIYCTDWFLWVLLPLSLHPCLTFLSSTPSPCPYTQAVICTAYSSCPHPPTVPYPLPYVQEEGPVCQSRHCSV